ncbi:hypothetical protein GALL_270200 [mine drainage metagenome]|uniref:DUF4412 domain-containing protein n=1 Tax=mine drainage metagenome TaxID=410659 RepID=A0A1J5R530_9ZZZZ
MLRRLSLLVPALLAMMAAFAPVRASLVSAADLLDAKVQYTADFQIRTGVMGGFHGTVMHAHGRERRDFGALGGPQILLLRRDMDEATMLWPERKWYVTTSFSQAAALVGGFDGVMLNRRPTGSETINGEPCTRYAVTGTSAMGGSFRGTMWLTRDGILMRASGMVRFEGHETSVETSLNHLRRVHVGAASFARPADYTGLPIDLSKFGLKVR